MELGGQLEARAMIDSLNGWWSLAGVDGAVADRPVDWLALDAPKEAVALPLQEQFQNAPPSAGPTPQQSDWPDSILSLRQAIGDGVTLPGNGFGRAHIVSTGPAQARVMIISDLPDADESAAAELGSGSSGRMLRPWMSVTGLRWLRPSPLRVKCRRTSCPDLPLSCAIRLVW
jgi:uracil-DNA glycosylase